MASSDLAGLDAHEENDVFAEYINYNIILIQQDEINNNQKRIDPEWPENWSFKLALKQDNDAQNENLYSFNNLGKLFSNAGIYLYYYYNGNLIESDLRWSMMIGINIFRDVKFSFNYSKNL